MGIETTLEERGKDYGSFLGHSAVTQDLKRAMQKSSNWKDISDDKREALEMIAHKIGRILNGNPNLKDSWHDIVGYAALVDATLGE